MSVEDAAIELGISPQRVRVLCRGGRLGTRLGREYVITSDELEKFKATPRGKGRPPSVVYFLQDEKTGNIKIGVTGYFQGRFRAIRNGVEGELKPLGIIENASRRKEKELHEKFAVLSLGGEWFIPHPDLLEYIRENATPIETPQIRTGENYGGERPGAGRKPGKDYPHRLNVRVNREQFSHLEQSAVNEATTIADVIRQLVDRDMGGLPY